MNTNTPTSQTSVQEVDLDINDWIGGPDAGSVISPDKPAPTDAKPSIFSTTQQDLSFLNDEIDEPAETDDENKPPAAAAGTGTVTETSDEILDDLTNTDPAATVKPKSTKDGVVNFFKKQVDAGKMFLFDDYDESKQTVDEYLGSLTQKDLDELYELNLQQHVNEQKQKAPKEFFDALPDEMQYAAQYIANGGKDLKSLFRALSQVQETIELDPKKPEHQESIIRQFLTATQFGTPEEIESEIETFRDAALVGKKAEQWKPKLDSLQQKIVEQKVQDQAENKRKQEAAVQTYVSSVYDTLKGGELSGVKLDKNRQQALYQGLVDTSYQSITGKKTNQLGHLLEKYQFVEPNHSLIAEALWLLSDPKGYRDSLSVQAKNEVNEATRRTLKTEQHRKPGSNSIDHRDTSSDRKVIQRPTSIFKR